VAKPTLVLWAWGHAGKVVVQEQRVWGSMVPWQLVASLREWRQPMMLWHQAKGRLKNSVFNVLPLKAYSELRRPTQVWIAWQHMPLQEVRTFHGQSTNVPRVVRGSPCLGGSIQQWV